MSDFIGDDVDVTITHLAVGQIDPVKAEPMPIVDVTPPTTRPQADYGTSIVALPVSATIRVNLDGVDRLINQIGELVIFEAVLMQAISNAGLRDDSGLATSLAGIRQLPARIQESVLSI